MMVDDTIHIPSGYSYLQTHDFRLNEEHPPFIKVLSAIGLEHVRPELPFDSPGWSKAEEPGDPDDGTDTFCGDFFRRNADKFEQIIYWARVPVVFVPVVLAVFVWAFARNLFGDLAAILSVFFRSASRTSSPIPRLCKMMLHRPWLSWCSSWRCAGTS